MEGRLLIVLIQLEMRREKPLKGVVNILMNVPSVILAALATPITVIDWI